MSQGLARTQQLAEDLADELSRLGFSARRAYLVTTERGSLSGLEIVVVGAADRRQPGARGLSVQEHDVDLGVMAAVANSQGVAELDGLCLAVDRIKMLFDADVEANPAVLDLYEHAGALRHKTLAGLSYVQLENDPIWLPDHLAQFSQFTSVIRLTYRGA